MGKVIDMIGRRFGRLRVVALCPERDRSRHALWLTRCECDTEHVVRGDVLRKGESKSCGCLHREAAGRRSRTHGLSRSRAYSIWGGMMRRCYDPRAAGYCNYGGREPPIYVVEFWHTFEGWFADRGDPPDGLTQDRIDNDGPYAPWNVRWAPPSVQNANRRRRR